MSHMSVSRIMPLAASLLWCVQHLRAGWAYEQPPVLFNAPEGFADFPTSRRQLSEMTPPEYFLRDGAAKMVTDTSGSPAVLPKTVDLRSCLKGQESRELHLKRHRAACRSVAQALGQSDDTSS